MAWNADPWKDPLANHKLKWTLRCVTDVEIPEEEGKAKEEKKDLALKAGIRRIRDFGWGIQDGKKYVDKDGNEQKPDEKFLIGLRNFSTRTRWVSLWLLLMPLHWTLSSAQPPYHAAQGSP